MSEAYGGTSTTFTVPLLGHTRDRSWRSPMCVVHLSHGAQLEVLHVTADYSDRFLEFLQAPSLMPQDHPAQEDRLSRRRIVRLSKFVSRADVLRKRSGRTVPAQVFVITLTRLMES